MFGFSIGSNRYPEILGEIDLKPRKFLSSIPRRKKWKWKKRPKRKKTKNFVYQLSDINIEDYFNADFRENPSTGKVESGEILFLASDRVYLENNDFDEFKLISSAKIEGWEIPILNDVEDTTTFMMCPSRDSICIDQELYIVDSITFDSTIFLNQTVNVKYSYKEIKKLHRAMWHAKADSLKRWIIQKSWTDDEKLEVKERILKVVSNCKTCCEFKQPHTRPRDFGLRAEFPNEIMVADQAFLKDEESEEKYPFLHFMDVATRWSMATVMTGRGGNVKGKDVEKSLHLWEQIWGSPPQILFSDRGREFINHRIFEYCRYRNIIQRTSPVRTPASNGLIERHNGVLKAIAYKLVVAHRRDLQDGVIDFEDILLSAAAAKNSMVGKLGYSAQYLAFLNNHLCISEINPERSLPSISTKFRDHRNSVQDQVICRLNLQQQARKIVYDEQQRSTIARILSRRLQKCPPKLKKGAICDYTDESGTGRDWTGPCKVIECDGRIVVLEGPGAELIRIHRSRVRQRDPEGKVEVESVPVTREIVREFSEQAPDIEEPDFRNQHRQRSDNAFQREEIDEYVPYNPMKGFESEDDFEEAPIEGAESVESDRIQETSDITREVSQPIKRGRGRPRKNPVPSQIVKGRVVAGHKESVAEPKRKRGRPRKAEAAPKPLKRLCDVMDEQYKKKADRPMRTAKHELGRILKSRMSNDLPQVGQGVVTRAQRARLVNAMCVDAGSDRMIDEVFVTKEDLKLKECKDGPEFDIPKQKEWDAWMRNDSFDWVKDEGQQRVRCRWVLTKRRVFTKQQLIKLLEKEVELEDIPELLKLKARLTPQGTLHQDPDRADIDCESPTANKLSMRILLSRAAISDWELETFDVSEAFLQQLPIDELEGILRRELYVSPPKEFKKPGYLMKMKKAAYGFADAPRRWFMTSDQALKEIGFKSCKVDPATYYLHRIDGDRKVLSGMICLHVDDGLCAGDDHFKVSLGKYYKRFKVNADKGRDDTVEYTGAEITKTGKNCISISQKLYSAIITEPEVDWESDSMKDPDRLLNEGEIGALRQYVGMLGWPAIISRPDLASGTNMLQTAMSGPRVSDLKSARKLFVRLQKTGNTNIKYRNVEGTDGTCLLMFSDASNHNLKDENGDKTQSQAGWILIETEMNANNVMPEHPKGNVLAWRSYKIKRTCRSSFAAETIAAVEAADALIFAAYLYEEILSEPLRRYLCVDSMNLKDHTTQFNNNLAERRLKVDLYSLKENMAQGEIKLLWVDGQENPEDGLTKASSTALKPLVTLMDKGRIPVETMLAWIGINGD